MARRCRSGLPVLLLALLAGCGPQQNAPQTQSREHPVFEAEILSVQARDFAELLWLPAEVVPARRFQLTSRVTGLVRAVHVQEGDQVEQGQILAEIDAARVLGEIATAEAQILSTEAELQDALEDLQRFRRLARTEVLAQEELGDAELREVSARARLSQARADLKAVMAELDYVEVHAPERAMIVERLLEPGELAGVDAPLLVLQSQGPVEIEAYVPVSRLDTLEPGAQHPIRLGHAGEVIGRISRIVPHADPLSRRFKVRWTLDAKHLPATGSPARVGLSVGQVSALSVPDSAIVLRAGIQGVYVRDADARARFRSLRMGARMDGHRLLLAGLQAGDEVIINPSPRLSDGQRVTLP